MDLDILVMRIINSMIIHSDTWIIYRSSCFITYPLILNIDSCVGRLK